MIHVMFVSSDKGVLSGQRKEAAISPLLSCGALKLFPFTQSNPWNALPGKLAYFLHLTEKHQVCCSVHLPSFRWMQWYCCKCHAMCLVSFQADLVCCRIMCCQEQLGLHVTTLPIHRCIMASMCLAPQTGSCILHSIIVLCLCIHLSHCALTQKAQIFILLFSVERRRFKEEEGW